MWLVWILACSPSDDARPDCAKVLCGADEYCLREASSQDTGFGTNIPVCTAAPESCGGTPTCDCLPECTTCSEDDGLVRCDVDG